MKLRHSLPVAALVALAGLAATACAQTVRIGAINTYSGANASPGDQLDKGLKLYLKLNGGKLPPGVRLELIVRDDGGADPASARRLAQELITRDKVHFLTGVLWTPNAAAIAPITAQAKVPFVIMVASGVAIPRLSPYVARVSFTLWQSAYPLGQWAGKRFKHAYSAVSDFAPGREAEEAFLKGFTEGGGELIGSVRMPLANPDFVPYLQRVKDAKPEAVFVFVPGGGNQSTAMMKAYDSLGLAKAGIRLIGSGDLTADEELSAMPDAVLGVMTVHHYSAAGDRPANRAYVAAYKKEYGEARNPGYVSVGGWDGMDAIFRAIRATSCKTSICAKCAGSAASSRMSNWKPSAS